VFFFFKQGPRIEHFKEGEDTKKSMKRVRENNKSGEHRYRSCSLARLQVPTLHIFIKINDGLL
jgi:hypothetical protein